MFIVLLVIAGLCGVLLLIYRYFEAKKLSNISLQECLDSLQKNLDSARFGCSFLVGDKLYQNLEDTFNVNFKALGFDRLCLADEKHKVFTSRLNCHNDDDFWTVGCISAWGGNDGYDATIVALRVLGIVYPGGSWKLIQDVADMLEVTFTNSCFGTGPIYPNDGIGVNDSFLMTFQCVNTFTSVFKNTLSDEARAAASQKNTASWDAYYAEQTQYNVKKHLNLGGTPPKPPKEYFVRGGLLSMDCDVDSKLYKKVSKDFKIYIKELRKSNSKLDEFALIFLPRVIGRSVHVYSIELLTWQVYHPLVNSTLSPIYLLVNGMHYYPIVLNKLLRKRLWEKI